MILSKQQQKGLRLDRNLIVSAGAGAGKTSLLTARYISLLDSGFKPSRILCLTFTNKAADEMRTRISEKLMERTNTSKPNHDTSNLMAEVYRSPIVTFDSLFLSLYQEYASHYWKSPQLSIIDSVVKNEILNGITNRFYKLLNDYQANKIDETFGGLSFSLLGSVALRLYQLDRFERTISIVNEITAKNSDRYEVFYYNFQSKLDIDSCKALTVVLDNLTQMPQEELWNWCRQFNESVFPCFDEKNLTTLNVLEKLRNVMVHYETNSLGEETILHAFKLFLLKDIVLETLPNITSTAGELRYYSSILISAFISEYNFEKQKRGLADYQDVQNKISWLLENTDLKNELSNQFDHVLIDEFQDTNFSQWEIIQPFVWDYKKNILQQDKLFIVGDPKQSIYKFRNAQVEVFKYLRNEIIRSNTYYHAVTSEEDCGVILLSENYRSCQSVLSFINTTFENEFMLGKKGQLLESQVEYQPMDFAKQFDIDAIYTGWVELCSYQEKQPEKVCLDVVRQYIEKINQNQIPFDKSKDRIAILASKNMVLLKVSAQLKRNNISHQLGKTDNVLRAQEGLDCYNFIRFLSDPNNDIFCLGILKSPFVMLTDDTILIVKNITKDLSIYQNISNCQIEELPINAHEKTKLSLFKKYANQWLERVTNENVSSILWDALSETAAWSLYKEFFNGDIVIKNIEEIIDHLIDYESKESRTILDVRLYLENLSYDDIGISEITSVNTDQQEIAIDLLTIHKAKGLTYKYVIVINTFDDRTQSDASFFKSHLLLGMAYKGLEANKWEETEFYKLVKKKEESEDEAEKNRLVYVALTRATHGMTILFKQQELDDKQETEKKGNSKKTNTPSKRKWNTRFNILNEKYSELSDVRQFVYQFTNENQTKEIKAFNSTISNKNEQDDFVNLLYDHRSKPFQTDSYFTNFSATGLMAVNQCGTANRFKKMSYYLLGTKPKQQFPAALKGTIIHELMACHQDAKKENLTWEKYANVPDDIKLDIKQTITAIWQQEEIANYLKYENRHEVSFFTTIHQRFIQGSIDWLIINKTEATILDFKSNKIGKNDLEKLFNQYEVQLKLYALAVAKIYDHIETFTLNIFSTSVLDSYKKNLTRREVFDFEKTLFDLIIQIESKSFDRDFKQTEPINCIDCAFYSHCYET